MIGAFFSGISGLMAMSQAINVVGNNIANVNTVGYKGSRTTFADMLYQSIASSAGTTQVGRGVALATVDTIFSQGSFESTSQATDLAIGGEGFFIVRVPDSGRLYYTRAGQFRFDKNGNLVNPLGYVLQGKKMDPITGTATGVDTDIVISMEPSQPQQTSNIGIAVNLQSDDTVPAQSFDPEEASSYNYSTSITIYDSLGQPHVVTVYFVKTADNEWDWHVCDDSGQEVGDGHLVFNTNGLLIPDSSDWQADLTFDFSSQGASNDQAITLSFMSESGGWRTTQYPIASKTNFQTQDGYPPGVLMNVTVSPDGTISGHYSNGQILSLYQITLARFNNPSGLVREGGNLFSETLESGVPYTGAPGEGGLGQINANSLEMANVDLATEFVKMIIAQRGFQANARVITTSDEVLQELMNLKR